MPRAAQPSDRLAIVEARWLASGIMGSPDLRSSDAHGDHELAARDRLGRGVFVAVGSWGETWGWRVEGVLRSGGPRADANAGALPRRRNVEAEQQLRPTRLLARLLLAMVMAILAASADAGCVISETFARDPATSRWQSHGEVSLFRWAGPGQRLEVTWDSSCPNSFFYLPLPTVLGKDDDFEVAFDLELIEVKAGNNPAKPFAFELAVGFFNSGEAVKPDFLRGTGQNSPNLVEFDYFPDTGFGATLWPTIVSTNGVFNYNGNEDYTLVELSAGVAYRVELAYTAGQQILNLRITQAGNIVGPVNGVRLRPDFTDFRVNAFGILSYSDQGAGGSILAKAWLDNVQLRLPDPPVQNLIMLSALSFRRLQFQSQPQWRYQLERSIDLQNWTVLSSPTDGDGQVMILIDSDLSTSEAFYRVKAERR